MADILIVSLWVFVGLVPFVIVNIKRWMYASRSQQVMMNLKGWADL
jgi:hypothetical protein